MQRCAQYQIFQKNISKYQFVWFKILIDNNKKNIKENSEKKRKCVHATTTHKSIL